MAVGRNASALPEVDKFVQIDSVEIDTHGLGFDFSSSWGSGTILTNLLGDFNVENLALSLGVLLSWDVRVEDAIERLHQLVAVPGRMEAFGGAAQPLVVVDYAHTPDALQKALQALRLHTRGELVCVFGYGGDRDPGKRHADRVILTDDNPRSEDGDRIIAAIQSGMTDPGRSRIDRQRAHAIRSAIAATSSGDVVLIAGKGHEDHQQVGDLRLPFSDVAQVRRALGSDGDD